MKRKKTGRMGIREEKKGKKRYIVIKKINKIRSLRKALKKYREARRGEGGSTNTQTHDKEKRKTQQT